jgi:hypothetical protein
MARALRKLEFLIQPMLVRDISAVKNGFPVYALSEPGEETVSKYIRLRAIIVMLVNLLSHLHLTTVNLNND